MWNNQYWNWLFDDWEAAKRRSLMRPFTRRQLNALRAQRRVGQVARVGVLLLPLLVLLSFINPAAKALILEGVLAWSAGECLLLMWHLASGVRAEVSYGWAFHHSRPMLLGGLSARLDLKVKAFLAAAFATVALFSLLLLLSSQGA